MSLAREGAAPGRVRLKAPSERPPAGRNKRLWGRGPKVSL